MFTPAPINERARARYVVVHHNRSVSVRAVSDLSAAMTGARLLRVPFETVAVAPVHQ